MKLLIDTHVFLWLVQQEPIPPGVLAQLEELSNEVFVSVITPWEMQLKVGVGKLLLSKSVQSIVETQITRSSMALLPITLQHIDALSRLPNHHRDPFDRLLVSQAICEGLTLVRSDQVLAKYGATMLWE